jgi:DNA-binding GntR family transcriptional regulator
VQRFANVVADHRQMLTALAEHDTEGAAALAAAHSTRAKQVLLARMREKLAAGGAAATQLGGQEAFA